MNWDKFQIGFWHPFGDHADEPSEEILIRKSRECNKNGWTLWSFQNRSEEKTLIPWVNYIQKSGEKRVFVLCSERKGAKNTKMEPDSYKEYRNVEDYDHFKEIPNIIDVPHPGAQLRNATAFMVKKVIELDEDEKDVPFKVKWYRTKDSNWKSEKLPTRPEYLIKRGGRNKPRRVRAVLELKSPYVVILKKLG